LDNHQREFGYQRYRRVIERKAPVYMVATESPGLTEHMFASSRSMPVSPTIKSGLGQVSLLIMTVVEEFGNLVFGSL